MTGKGSEAEPKPFVLVDIPREEPHRKKATTHEKFKDLTGQLELEFTVVSEYLFVGSGGYDFDPQAKGDRPDVWHTFYRRDGQICIPGTSTKGAIRAIVEAISNSCVLQLRRGERTDPPHRRCELRDVGRDKLCPACRLFGTTGLRGRIHFGDAFPIGDVSVERVKIAELWPPKWYINARRFYAHKTFQHLPDQRPEKNFRFVEALRRNARFKVEMVFENIAPAELGLIFHALGWKPETRFFSHAFTPKLGGAKSRCFGAVRFEPKRLRLWKGNSWEALLSPETLESDALKQFIGDCLKECQRNSALFHRGSWERLVDGMQPQDEPCPRGNY